MSFDNIPNYPQKKEDLLDCYNYLIKNTNYYECDEEFDISDFDFEYKEIDISTIKSEIQKLKEFLSNLEHDQLRIKKIEECLSLDFPIYLYKGEIIAGVHRSVAYLNKKITTIPVVEISIIG